MPAYDPFTAQLWESLFPGLRAEPLFAFTKGWDVLCSAKIALYQAGFPWQSCVSDPSAEPWPNRRDTVSSRIIYSTGEQVPFRAGSGPPRPAHPDTHARAQLPRDPTLLPAHREELELEVQPGLGVSGTCFVRPSGNFQSQRPAVAQEGRVRALRKLSPSEGHAEGSSGRSLSPSPGSPHQSYRSFPLLSQRPHESPWGSTRAIS